MRPRLGPWAFVGIAALLWHVVQLGDPGFWSTLEIPVLARTQAALGESHRDLLRSPWLPDALRTLSYRISPSELGLRLPHALASSGLVTFAFALAFAKTKRIEVGALAALVALSMPGAALHGHTVLGNPIFELSATAAIVLGITAAQTDRRAGARRLLALGAALCVLAASVSAGAVLGAALPLAIVATAGSWSARLRVALFVAVAILTAIGVTLILMQGDGYIPWLGVAKDPRLSQMPAVRRFPAVLSEFGAACFPWLGFVAIGATAAANRKETVWMLLSLCIVGAWALRYGPTVLPVTVPAAVTCAMAIDGLLAWDEGSAYKRRFVVLVVAGSLLVARQDAKRDPGAIALAGADLGHEYPAAELQTVERLQAIATWVLLALLVALVLRWRGVSRTAAHASMLLAATASALLYAKVLLPAHGAMFSVKRPLERHEAWTETGTFSAPLAVYQLQDRGIPIYAPPDRQTVRQRHALQALLAESRPRAALVRDSDVPWIDLAARNEQHPFHVLDRSHQSIRLVANMLPPGAVDLNEIASVRFDEAPILEHATLVRFGENLELTGWEVDGPLVRGRSHTLELAFRVLSRVPAATQVHARFIHGRLSHINGQPQPIAEEIYPPALWRPGDHILHRFTFAVPPLEIVPGTYDFVVGLRRGDQGNFEISRPSSEAPSPFGVVIRDKQKQFAKIGQVEVW